MAPRREPRILASIAINPSLGRPGLRTRLAINVGETGSIVAAGKFFDKLVRRPVDNPAGFSRIGFRETRVAFGSLTDRVVL